MRLLAPLRASVAVLLCLLLCLSTAPRAGDTHGPASSGTTAPSAASGLHGEDGRAPATSEHAELTAKVRRGGLQASGGAPTDCDRVPAHALRPVAGAPTPLSGPATGVRIHPEAFIAGRDPSLALPPGHAPPRA